MREKRSSTGLVLLAVIVIAGLALVVTKLDRSKEAGVSPEMAVKPIRIAMSGQYPPFNYFDDQNALTGFDVEISLEVAKRLGRQPELIATAWDGIIAGLITEKYDLIIGSMAVTEERQRSVNFSDPYYTSGAQLFVRQDSKIGGKQDLKGQVIGVTLGTTYEQEVRKIKGVKRVVTYSGVPDMYMELDNGHIDAFVTDRLVGLYGIKKAKRDFVPAGDPLYTETIAIALRKDDPELLEGVNKALADMKADGAYAEISTKWFGRDISAAEE